MKMNYNGRSFVVGTASIIRAWWILKMPDESWSSIQPETQLIFDTIMGIGAVTLACKLMAPHNYEEMTSNWWHRNSDATREYARFHVGWKQ